jgi:hypothetical protein
MYCSLSLSHCSRRKSCGIEQSGWGPSAVIESGIRYRNWIKPIENIVSLINIYLLNLNRGLVSNLCSDIEVVS